MCVCVCVVEGPWWLSGKESACSEGDRASIPDQEDLEKGMATHPSVLSFFAVEFLFLTTPTATLPIFSICAAKASPQPPFLTPVFLPGESHGQRSLAPTVHGVENLRTGPSD